METLLSQIIEEAMLMRKKPRTVYTCVARIYVNMTDEPHCLALPDYLVPFCEEGRVLHCGHQRMIMEKMKKQ